MFSIRSWTGFAATYLSIKDLQERPTILDGADFAKGLFSKSRPALLMSTSFFP